MTRANFRVLLTTILMLLMVSCHPEGCYGPRAFNYNTTGVAVSNLVGNYTFDGTNTKEPLAWNILRSLGAGGISLRQFS